MANYTNGYKTSTSNTSLKLLEAESTVRTEFLFKDSTFATFQFLIKFSKSSLYLV